MTDWTLIDFSEPEKKEAAPVKAGAVSTCPKCGRPLKARGQHFHIRSCKGTGKE